MAALLVSLLACSGLSGPNAAAPSGGSLDAPQAIPGAPAGDTATKFDPDDTREFGFVESSHQVSKQGDSFVTAFKGIVDHLEKTPTSGGKFEAVPCCEGRWLLVRNTTHQTCAAAAIGGGGTWEASVPAGDLRFPTFDFFLGNVGFSPSAAVLGDCSNVLASDWSKFPIGYVPLPPSSGPLSFVADNETVTGNDTTASSGIQSIAHPAQPIAALPLLDTPDFSRFNFQLPQGLSPSNDSDN